MAGNPRPRSGAAIRRLVKRTLLLSGVTPKQEPAGNLLSGKDRHLVRSRLLRKHDISIRELNPRLRALGPQVAARLVPASVVKGSRLQIDLWQVSLLCEYLMTNSRTAAWTEETTKASVPPGPNEMRHAPLRHGETASRKHRRQPERTSRLFLANRAMTRIRAHWLTPHFVTYCTALAPTKINRVHSHLPETGVSPSIYPGSRVL